MREIELFTRDGNFVAVVDVLPFPDSGMPEVVMWGNRTFTAGIKTQPHDGGRWRFTEAFAFVSLTPSPGRCRETLEEDPVKPIEDLIVGGPRTETLHGTPKGEHTKIDPQTGQQKDYVVLSDHERAKGFVRPVRSGYIHEPKLAGPKHPLRDLTADEATRYASCGYAKFEEYPKGQPGGALGKYWTQKELDRIARGCGSLTTMGDRLAETYARQPDFYTGTFCVSCKEHYPVGEKGEFVWDNTDIKVGT